MKCEKYFDLIDDFAENELDAQTADEVSLHIFACPHCEQTLENLMREKQIYSQLFFEIEPPANLADRFQAKLEKEFEARQIVSNSPKIVLAERLANLFSLHNLLPAAAALCVLLLFGFGLFWLKNSTNERAASADADFNKSKQFLPANLSEEKSEKIELQKFQPEIAKTLNEPARIFEKEIPKKELFDKVENAESKRENFQTVKNQAENVSTSKKSAAPKTSDLSEGDKLQMQELQAFEQGAAKQMEKIEMLLRSFRNARFSEETEKYDVSFETEQARKLLAANENLRARAENYGDFYTAEILEKIEPYLLDIANLENAPSTETVLDIKQRVRNQNLIASLQGF